MLLKILWHTKIYSNIFALISQPKHVNFGHSYRSFGKTLSSVNFRLNEVEDEVFLGKRKLCHSQDYLNKCKSGNFQWTNDISVKCQNSNTKNFHTTSSCNCDCPNFYGRHNYHKDIEAAVNQQILCELNACYAYLAMACYFGRTEVALPGAEKFFMKMHEEEHGHANQLIQYQNQRGGHVVLASVLPPECQDWKCVCLALSVAIEMEKLVKEKLLCVGELAVKHNDTGVNDLMTGIFIPEQDRSIQEISRLLTRATMLNESKIGQYIFDRELYEHVIKDSSKTYK